MSSCKGLAGWDLVHWDPMLSASGYGTFAALLAGFAVSGLMWIASSDPEQRSAKSPAALGVLVTLLPLVGATLFYSEISGEDLCDRAYVGTFVASFMLTIGTVLLLIMLALLLDGLFNDQGPILQWFSCAVLVIGTGTVWVGNAVLVEAISGEEWSNSLQSYMQAVFLVAGLIAAAYRRAAVQPVRRWLSLRRPARPQRSGHHRAGDGRAQTTPVSGGSHETLFVPIVFLGALGFLAFYGLGFVDPTEDTALSLAWARCATWVVFAVAASRFIGRLEQPPIVRST